MTGNFIRAYWNIGQRSKQCSRHHLKIILYDSYSNNSAARKRTTIIITIQEAQLMLTNLRDAFGGQSRQWRRQDFCLGAASRRRGGEAPRGWGAGRGCPPPHRRMGLGRGLCPLPRKFLII